MYCIHESNICQLFSSIAHPIPRPGRPTPAHRSPQAGCFPLSPGLNRRLSFLIRRSRPLLHHLHLGYPHRLPRNHLRRFRPSCCRHRAPCSCLDQPWRKTLHRCCCWRRCPCTCRNSCVKRRGQDHSAGCPSRPATGRSLHASASCAGL